MNNDQVGTQMPVGSAVTPPQPGAMPVSSLAPEARPMEQAKPAGIEASPKKRKTGLIVGIIIAVVLLIGGGITAAVLLLNNKKQDPVAVAMDKIMGGEAPSNVKITGDIDINVGYQASPISHVKIALQSGIVPSSLINNSVANITVTLRNVGDFTVEFDEMYAADGDLYFKINGATEALEDSGILQLLRLTNNLPEVVDCGGDEQCQAKELAKSLNCAGDPDMNCSETSLSELEGQVLEPGSQSLLDEDTLEFFAAIVDAVELIDGEWLRISTDEFSALAGGALEQSEASCIVDLVTGINSNSRSAAELFKKYPFVTSTNDGVEISSKAYTVYKLGIDNENFANFVNSIPNPNVSEKVYTCLGLEDNIKIDEQDAAYIASELPIIYAEVDENNDFSRLYIKSTLNDGSDCACTDSIDTPCDCPLMGDTEIVMDLDFSYPANIPVPEPYEYIDYSDFIEEINSNFFYTSESGSVPERLAP